MLVEATSLLYVLEGLLVKKVKKLIVYLGTCNRWKWAEDLVAKAGTKTSNVSARNIDLRMG